MRLVLIAASLSAGCGAVATAPEGVPARELAWSEAEELGTGAYYAMAVDAEGAATIVWHDARGENSDEAMLASRSVPGRGWRTPRVIGPRGLTWPSVAVNDRGDAIALWQGPDPLPAGGRQCLWAAVGGSSDWEDPQALACNVEATPNSRPVVLMGDLGEAVVVSEHYVNGGYELIAARHASDQGWYGLTPISPRGWWVYGPSVLMDSRGGAVVVWSEDGGQPLTSIWANELEPAAGWQGARQLSTSPLQGQLRPTVRSIGPAELIAVWEDGTRIVARRRLAGAWQASEVVSNGSGDWCAALAANRTGGAVVSWLRSGQPAIWASRLQAGAWKSEKIASLPTVSYECPSLAIDERGAATVVWEEHGSADRVLAVTALAGDSWSQPQVLAEGAGVHGRVATASVCAGGDTFFAAWTEWGTDVRLHIRVARGR